VQVKYNKHSNFAMYRLLLSCRPFHDTREYPWAAKLEAQHGLIRDELMSVLSDEKKLAAGNNVWVGALQQEGQVLLIRAMYNAHPLIEWSTQAYGPQWKTLGLQDRGVWDITNVKLLPGTTKAVLESGAPSCEVLFARQGPRSGIAPHSDNNNFILTYHLGIAVPEPVGTRA
jgi:aspartyl/asparaginyl beta-hydroxylase (cupin superfamily)